MNESTMRDIVRFRDDRNWKQFHNPKDLALSLTLEAAELLERFQWKTAEEAVGADREGIAEELADVLIYCVLLADVMEMDIDAVVAAKLKKNAEKYPLEKAYGVKRKYDELREERMPE